MGAPFRKVCRDFVFTFHHINNGNTALTPARLFSVLPGEW